MTKEELRAEAAHLGIDLLGVTTVAHLDARLPRELRPSRVSEYLPGFLVLAARIPTGLMGAEETEARSLACGAVHRALEEAAAELAYWMEERDQMAVVLPSLIMDFRGRDELSNTPAGQGSLFLRLAAVEAGLGTLGLNTMLLTPQFGPRVYLCGMMTSLELTPDEPLAEELCPGLEACGLCAAVCPADAIPRSAPRAGSLDGYRGLDTAACAGCSQPHGVRAFVDYLQRLLGAESDRQIRAQLESPETSLIWFHMTIMRQGAFTGCGRCLQVCPVGEDFERLRQSPHRQGDVPAGFGSRVEGELVTIDLLAKESP